MDFFKVLGISPARGRTFDAAEETPGGSDAAVISDGFWHSHFGGDDMVLGRAVTLDGKSMTVVGILPAGFSFSAAISGAGRVAAAGGRKYQPASGADPDFTGRKEYSDRKWACCSGTLPQVSADYGINIYLRDARSIFVNLYVPSTVRWTQDGARVTVTQRSEYPLEGHVRMEVAASRPADFEVQLRIPLPWAQRWR